MAKGQSEGGAKDPQRVRCAADEGKQNPSET